MIGAEDDREEGGNEDQAALLHQKGRAEVAFLSQHGGVGKGPGRSSQEPDDAEDYTGPQADATGDLHPLTQGSGINSSGSSSTTRRGHGHRMLERSDYGGRRHLGLSFGGGLQRQGLGPMGAGQRRLRRFHRRPKQRGCHRRKPRSLWPEPQLIA